MLGQGRKNKEIAERLFITERTVGHYLTSIFAKLEVSGRLELLTYAHQHNLAKIAPLAVPDQLLKLPATGTDHLSVAPKK